jgi:hypothetical protein
MSRLTRLSLATMGYRGGREIKTFINETSELSFSEIKVSIEETILVNSVDIVSVVVDSIESVSVDVKTLEIEGAV